MKWRSLHYGPFKTEKGLFGDLKASYPLLFMPASFSELNIERVYPPPLSFLHSIIFIYSSPGWFCHLMTHAVLLFKEADDSLVTHILGWGGGCWRPIAGQTDHLYGCKPQIYRQDSICSTALMRRLGVSASSGRCLGFSSNVWLWPC